MKNRVVYLDLIRIIACFFVIVNHTNSQIFQSLRPSVTWFASVTYFFVCKTAVPLFIMVSGVVLLQKKDDYRKIASRLLRITIVLLVVSFLYYLNDIYNAGRQFSLTEYITDLYQGKITHAYWYLYLYMGILIMLPILQKAVRAMEKTDYIYFFVISFGVLGVVPILVHYHSGFQYAPYMNLSIFNVYIGILLAGYFVEKYLEITPRIVVSCIFLIVIFTIFNIVMTYREYIVSGGEGTYWFLHDRTFTTIVIPSICLFIIIKYFSKFILEGGRVQNIILAVGSCTFGAYLAADFIIEKFSFIYDALKMVMHPILAVVIFEIVVFLTGVLVTRILRMIPCMRKIF